MAKKPTISDLPEAMKDDQLDGVVGGLTTLSSKETPSKVALVDAVGTPIMDVGVKPGGSIGIGIEPVKVSMSLGTPDIVATTESDLAASFRGAANKGDGVGALNSAVDTAIAKLKTSGYDADSAKAVAWSTAYEQMSKGASGAFETFPEVKKAILSHAEDAAKGIGIAVAVTQDLGGALTKTTNLLAEAGAQLKGVDLDNLVHKGSGALQAGLSFAAETREGKALLGAINDPANIEAWKNVVAEAALSISTPTLVTPLAALCSLVEGGAIAKVFGNDAPAEMKQVANAVTATIASLQDTFVAGYKSGYLGLIGNTGSMLYDASRNVLDLGKAMVSGDANAMRNAAVALCTDLFNDYKGLLTSYFVDTPKVVIEGLGKAIGTCLDKLGATPYVNEAAAVTAQALKDFGEMAKNGTVEAVNAIGDFARNGVNGAATVAEDLAKQGVKGAMDVMNSLAAEGQVAISTIENLVKAGANGAAAALESLARAGVNGAVAGVENMVKEGRMALGVLENLARSGVNGALSSVESLAKQGFNGASAAIESLARQGVAGAIDAAETLVKGGKMALSTIEDLARSGVSGAIGAIDHLARAGSAEAVRALGNLASGGLAAAATALVEVAKLGVAAEAVASAVEQIMKSGRTVVIDGLVSEAAKFARTIDDCANILRIGIDKGSQAALNAATELARTAIGNAQLILFDGIGKAVFQGGAYAQTAINELNNIAKLTGNTAQLAVHTLGNMASVGVAASQTAINALSDVARAGVQQADNAVRTLGNLAQTGSTAAINALTEVGRGISGTAKLAVNTLESVAKAGYSEAKSAVENLARDGVEEARKIVNAAGGFFENLWGNISGSKLNPSNW